MAPYTRLLRNGRAQHEKILEPIRIRGISAPVNPDPMARAHPYLHPNPYLLFWKDWYIRIGQISVYR